MILQRAARRLHRVGWLLAAAQLTACVTGPDFPALTTGSATGEERRLLVTFGDRSIGRDLPANPLDLYRPRGGYANSSWSLQKSQDLAARHGLRLVTAWPVTVLGVTCVVYEVPPGRALEAAVRSLGSDPEVETVQPMHRFRSLGEVSANPYNDPYFPLQRALKAMRIAAAHRLATGRGVRIGVIDSGVDADHPDLAGQVAVAENLAKGAGGDTAEVHGTAVAGVIAARSQNHQGIVGVAPGAELYALRACWSLRPGTSEAACNSFTLALAVNEAIRLGVRIINLSLAGPDDPLVARLLRAALDRGIFIVAADLGPGDPANPFPADLPGVIAVHPEGTAAGPHSRTADRISAPGHNILTTLPHATYDFMSGSSVAAPHVAGLLALMLEVKPELDLGEALRSLKSRALAAADAPGEVDACLLLVRLGGTPGCAETVAHP